jgi:predicted enzyme related to lactoylglutathione lyase
MNGQFVWYELTTPDVDAAQKFYPRVAGWGTQAFDRDYTMWTSGGVPIAGLFRLTDEMRRQGVPPNWMPYVESSDVDETAAKATSLGGRVVHGPADVPGAGRFAVVQDPHGAVFGVYRADNPGGAWDGTPVVGRFSWHELMTADHAAAFAFYQALFGWEKAGEMDMGGGQTYLMFGQGGKMYGGIFTRPPEMAGMHPFWLVYIHVKDVARAVAAATKAGATVHRPQMDIPGGAIAILGDPQGAGFAVHHANAEVPAAKAPAKKTVKKVAKKVARKAATKKTAKKAAAAKKRSSKTVAKRSGRTAAKKSTRKQAKPAARPSARTKAKRKR